MEVEMKSKIISVVLVLRLPQQHFRAPNLVELLRTTLKGAQQQNYGEMQELRQGSLQSRAVQRAKH